METRNLMNPFKQRCKNQNSRRWLKLLPTITFLLATLFFILPLPVQAIPQTNDAPSMSGNSYSFRPSLQKQDFSFAPLKWVVPNVSSFLLLNVTRSYEVIPRLAAKYRYIYTAIRAPPKN